MSKPRLSFWQIWNMSFGFLGIQFGWGLQMANMSPIFKTLGAEADKIAFLWLAAPVTGLIIQPIIGSMSDRTWNRFGRRRPYFLFGAILSSLTLIVMPNSSAIWMAAGLLWVLDASINISMEPFRAFVADKLNPEQRTTGFVTQSFFIGAGAALSSAMPYIFRYLGLEGNTSSGIPLTVKYSFQLGALVFLGAVVWTVFTSKEYPPENMEEFLSKRKETRSATSWFSEIFSAIREMPQTMKQLAAVQVFTWLGLFCMWLYFGLSTARHVFGAIDRQALTDQLMQAGQTRFQIEAALEANKSLQDKGAEWGGVCFAVYSIVTFVVAFVLPRLAALTSRKAVHACALVLGGISLLSVFVIRDQNLLLIPMVGIGIAWASILSMPYAMLSGALPPARMGVYMGVFNFFIVIPEIIASLTFQPLIKHALNNDPLRVVMLGGASLLVAAALVSRVRDVAGRDIDEAAIIEADEYAPFSLQESAQPVPSSGLIDEK
jgi:maltose/moltooligosaccharide transporter